jgi:inhibitor of cysteine peptidase
MMSRFPLLLLVLAVAGCNQRPSFDDPSRTIDVRRGSEFQLELTSNQSTGFRWVLADSAALGPLRLVGTDYEIPWRDRSRAGAGGTETWTFRAASAGTGEISLVYKRPWETRPPVDSARFRVTVR